MIFDSIKNGCLYTGLGPGFKEAFEFINKTGGIGMAKLPIGRHDLAGGVYCLVQEYETKPQSQGMFEAHRKYIDLQYIISGRERQNFANCGDLRLTVPYNEEKDLTVYEGAGSSLVLNSGFFAVYFPDDVHMPNLQAAGAPEKTIKAVFKIPA
ncbi:MAG: YhcH/YjgK/YiaL family protein [Treponema sp.]|nr:YhcH/YjgK/YiaL family protein [Treponema sp.]